MDQMTFEMDERKPTQQERMVYALRDAGALGVTSRELCVAMGIFKYSSRISELRRAGFIIRAERVRGTLYRYVLARDGWAADPSAAVNDRCNSNQSVGE